MKEHLIKRLIYIIIIINTSMAQFDDFDSKIDLTQIRESDRFHFQDVKENVNDFYVLNIFGSDLEDLGIVGTLHIIIESIIEIDNQKIINAYGIITNRNDIIMMLRSFSFPVFELKNISYNPNTFNTLSSFLEFGAYIIIANELDTYEKNSGNQYYNMAMGIASEGKESAYSNGWSDRWKKCKEMQENIFLRNVKYYFFSAYENFLAQNPKEFEKHIYLLHESIESNNDFIGIDNNTKNFLKAYCNNIAEYYFEIEFKVGLEYLADYDIDNKETYQKFINMLP